LLPQGELPLQIGDLLRFLGDLLRLLRVLLTEALILSSQSLDLVRRASRLDGPCPLTCAVPRRRPSRRPAGWLVVPLPPLAGSAGVVAFPCGAFAALAAILGRVPSLVVVAPA
jgi:hypothetical protein